MADLRVGVAAWHACCSGGRLLLGRRDGRDGLEDALGRGGAACERVDGTRAFLRARLRELTCCLACISSVGQGRRGSTRLGGIVAAAGAARRRAAQIVVGARKTVAAAAAGRAALEAAACQRACGGTAEAPEVAQAAYLGEAWLLGTSSVDIDADTSVVAAQVGRRASWARTGTWLAQQASVHADGALAGEASLASLALAALGLRLGRGRRRRGRCWLCCRGGRG